MKNYSPTFTIKEGKRIRGIFHCELWPLANILCCSKIVYLSATGRTFTSVYYFLSDFWSDDDDDVSSPRNYQDGCHTRKIMVIILIFVMYTQNILAQCVSLLHMLPLRIVFS